MAYCVLKLEPNWTGSVFVNTGTLILSSLSVADRLSAPTPRAPMDTATPMVNTLTKMLVMPYRALLRAGGIDQFSTKSMTAGHGNPPDTSAMIVRFFKEHALP